MAKEGRKMKFVRFMSLLEFEKYLRGELLINETKWREEGMRSDSSGFCFFDDFVKPESRMDYLSGIVDMEVVAVFERISAAPMKKAYGHYRDPVRDVVNNLLEALFKHAAEMEVPEYSITSYSKNTMRLVAAGVPAIGIKNGKVIKTIDWI